MNYYSRSIFAFHLSLLYSRRTKGESQASAIVAMICFVGRHDCPRSPRYWFYYYLYDHRKSMDLFVADSISKGPIDRP